MFLLVSAGLWPIVGPRRVPARSEAASRCGMTGGVEVTESATIAVVEGQVDAYNARDLDKIVTYYAPDAVVRDAAHGRFTARGQEEIRSLFDGVFAANPDLHADTPRNLWRR